MNNCNDYMSNDDIVEFSNRLYKAYIKRNKEKRFIFQYLSGDGNEIVTKKFFNIHSSSRLCFELFSWMADDKSIIDLEFEYKLPSIFSSHQIKLKGANMDVFYETKDTIYFVESKFTELAYNYIDKIPDAFYKELGFAKSQSGYPLHSTLLYRFNNNYELADAFPRFVNKIIKYIETNNLDGYRSYFDIKQEISHLFGICQYIYKNKKKINGYKISFTNLVYDFGDGIPDIASYFIKEAKLMVNAYIKALNLNTSFSYKIEFMQDFVKKIPIEKNAFGTNIPVCNILLNYDLKFFQ